MTPILAQAATLFTVPALAAVGAAAIAIPVIIHLMSRFRRRPEPWGAMRFLLEAYKKQRKRLQLERLLLLLVRCLVVLLAGLALAGPVLSGCTQGGGLAGLFTGTGTGRVVYIVVDDSLSTQTRAAGGTRLDGLKDEALSVVDELADGDRAVVIRTGRPPVWVTDAPTADRAALRDAINGITPRYGRSDVAAGLLTVGASMDELNVRDGNAVVVVLSDFSRSAAYLDEALAPELEGLGRRASIVTSLPAQGTDNVQVVSVTPRRRMVVATGGGDAAPGGGGGTISTEVKLRRFGGETQAQSIGLEVALLDVAGNEVASATRTVRWLAGQREAMVNLDLPAGLDGGETRGGRELVVVAQLVAANASAGVDALPADDRALAVVTLRERLQVALIDDGSKVNAQRGALQPWQYMRAVLAPSGAGGGGGAFEVSPLLPTAVSEGALAVVDAAVVLRPDQLTASGWDALAMFAQRGGLVWVWTPATTDETQNWPQTMTRVFALPWRVMGEQSVAGDASGGGDSGGGATPVDATTRAPEVLQYLAADWREKLGWVSVSRRLGLDAPEEDRWIVMDSSDAALPDRDASVLMAGRDIGAGALLFTATAPDARFTNLVVRPLFSPLVHDTLRGVLGDAGRLSPVVAGDAPDLGRGWRGAGELAWAPVLESERAMRDVPKPVTVRTDGDVAQVIAALDRPGVYRGEASASEKRLAVNADASAGDTHPGQPRLEQWLDKVGGAGGWSYLEDKRREQGGALASSSGDGDLTWPLLWVLLGLVVLEMFLARWFSHAADHDRPTAMGRAMSAWSGTDVNTRQNTDDSGERGRAA